MTPQDLKKALVARGFEVYRTSGTDIILADRVRENLVMDSGVRVRVLETPGLEVRVIMGARRSQFPDMDDESLFERIRSLAKPVLEDGFGEVTFGPRAVADPADSTKTLDVFCEVTFARLISSLEDGDASLKLALVVAKTAESRH